MRAFCAHIKSSVYKSMNKKCKVYLFYFDYTEKLSDLVNTGSKVQILTFVMEETGVPLDGLKHTTIKYVKTTGRSG